jgi:signal transduction histidine kinase/ActR/RegA family two-component response regulator
LANTVLIIEDNLPNMMMAQELLEIAGYQTLQAEDADKGIALARQHRPDLILMDMHLPIRNGYEASRILKSDPQTQDITIVAFTAMAMDDEKEKAINHGCSGVISKPIDVDHFAETISGFIQQKANLKAERQSTMPGLPVVPELSLHSKRQALKILSAMSQPDTQLVIEAFANMTQDVEIMSVEDRQTVMQRISAGKPDLLLLDMTIPNLDGHALLEELKADPSIASLPILLMVETTPGMEWISLLKQGNIDYVAKPFCREEIQIKVQNVLRTKLLEERLRQDRENLEQFLSLASHDLQAPLRKISQFTEMLQSSASNELSPSNVEILSVIHRSTQQMQEVLSDLLTFSRLHQRQDAFEAVSLADIVSEVLLENRDRIEALNARVDQDNMITLNADPRQLKQLLTELIDNALKFRREDTAPIIRLTSEIMDGPFCKITLIDNGMGFSPNHACRIFKPFERLHASSRYPGTGMGLAIAKKIVERHGGTIQAQPLPDCGAAFTILLPGKSVALAS